MDVLDYIRPTCTLFPNILIYNDQHETHEQATYNEIMWSAPKFNLSNVSTIRSTALDIFCVTWTWLWFYQ